MQCRHSTSPRCWNSVRLFQVVDKLAEALPVWHVAHQQREVGRLSLSVLEESSSRVSETERGSAYARAFGIPGGDTTSGQPNREFNDLWLRFVSAVSSFARQFKVDRLLRDKVPFIVNQELVRKTGRDLAANLSLHGYGIAYFLATELQNDIRDFIGLLSDDEIKSAYGARDMWQVIDQVATLELGGVRNSIRYRTMATAGAVIIRWLAKKAQELAGSSMVDVLDMDELSRPTLRPKGVKPTNDPTDIDLVNACEQWLAVTGTSDERVEEYAQPSEGPNTTSRPIQIPSMARDALEAPGVSLPMGMNSSERNGNGNGYGRR